MKTKFWHIGIASAIMATMGLAQAQTSPGAESPNSPASVQAPVGASGSVPGIPSDASNSSAPNGASNWNEPQRLDQAPAAYDASSSTAKMDDSSSTQGTFLGVAEPGLQSGNNNDGLNVPAAFGLGGAINR